MQVKLSGRPSAILSSLENFYMICKINKDSNAIFHALREHSLNAQHIKLEEQQKYYEEEIGKLKDQIARLARIIH